MLEMLLEGALHLINANRKQKNYQSDRPKLPLKTSLQLHQQKLGQGGCISPSASAYQYKTIYQVHNQINIPMLAVDSPLLRSPEGLHHCMFA